MGAGRPVRVALFVPPGRDRDRWIRVLAEYAFSRGWGLASICRTFEDALAVVVAGHADRILVAHAYELAPLVEVLTANPRDVHPSRRRTQRVRPRSETESTRTSRVRSDDDEIGDSPPADQSQRRPRRTRRVDPL